MHVLRIRDFALFIAGRFCNVLAAHMQWVAVGWYLYDLTRNAMTLGWAGLAAFVPIALLTLPAGDLADRMDRRRLLFAACASVWKRCGSQSRAKAMISSSLNVREPYSNTLPAGKSSK